VDYVHRISFTKIIHYSGLFENFAKRSLDFWVINMQSMVFAESSLVLKNNSREVPTLEKFTK
jgi:hypothetical protein